MKKRNITVTMMAEQNETTNYPPQSEVGSVF